MEGRYHDLDGLTGSDDVRGIVEGWRDRDEVEASWARAARAHAASAAPWVLHGP